MCVIVMILSFWTDIPEHCRPSSNCFSGSILFVIPSAFLDALLYGKSTSFKFWDNYRNSLVVSWVSEFFYSIFLSKTLKENFTCRQ